jgi:hypothetical protein
VENKIRRRILGKEVLKRKTLAILVENKDTGNLFLIQGKIMSLKI